MGMASESLAGRIVRGLDDALDHVTLRQQATGLLRRQLGFDLAVWALVDPATVMWTSCVLDGMRRDIRLENEIFANEYGEADVLKLTELAAGSKIGSVSAATNGEPQRSARFRAVLEPRGFSDELRLVFHDGASAWGALCLYRTGGRFSHDDLERLAPLGRPFAGYLRRALMRANAGPDAATTVGDEPANGLVLTDGTGRILEVTDDARKLLDLDRHSGLPQAVQAVVARRLAGLPASVAAPTPRGRWLAFHATALGSGSLAVIVERIRPHQIADLVVRGHGLTPREREVLAFVARGHSNRQIARALGLSGYTVQDHIKAILAKFGVSSRNELVATLFFAHYAPMHVADE